MKNIPSTIPTKMLGAIAGDTIGSVYEWNNIKFKLEPQDMAIGKAGFTDDSVLTCAVANGIVQSMKKLPDDWFNSCRDEARKIFMSEISLSLKEYGRKYPHAGYGGSFRRWMYSDDSQPYNSWGNGSAMRVSFAGWAANSPEEAEFLAECSAAVTHNHPEGIKGAKSVAGSIYILRNGGTVEDVREYASRYYDLDFTLDSIREKYSFDVSCQGSVPQAIVAFLTGKSFVDVIAEAISIGGDSDTIAAIAGGIAEVIYPIPKEIKERVVIRLDDMLWNTIADSVDFLEERLK